MEKAELFGELPKEAREREETTCTLNFACKQCGELEQFTYQGEYYTERISIKKGDRGC